MPTTTREDAESLVRRLFEVLEERDRDAFSKLFTDDFEFSPVGLDVEGYAEAEFSYYEAFPDLTYDLDRILVDGDHVVFRWRFVGTHAGQGGPEPLASVAPTHAEVDVSGINIGRIEDGRFAEMWAEWNTLELCQALGLDPFETD